MLYPKSLNTVIEQLQKLPGVGQKTAERYALSLLNFELEDVNALKDAIESVKLNIRYCEQCGNLTETQKCSICEDTQRDQSIICIVGQTTDAIAMEKTASYNGLYHVLNGLISPSKGILPDDLNIESLKHRLTDEYLKEIIIATNLTIEGDTTSLYLSKLINSLNPNIIVSRIAQGLPVGGHLDYADDLTIIKALEGRNKIL
ncbi:MAG: recombination protein RecR [Erysipelothrix sp.]|nr:recombination protein RecR [Erysipelothrix sp.]